MYPTRNFETTGKSQIAWPDSVSRVSLKKLIWLIGLLLCISGWQACYAQNAVSDFPTVGAVSESPTDNYHPGKAIWVDLVTTDVAAAATFYRRVFGWEFNYLAEGTYAQASFMGRPVGAITLYEEDQAVAGDAQWLVSFSAPISTKLQKKSSKQGAKCWKNHKILTGEAGSW